MDSNTKETSDIKFIPYKDFRKIIAVRKLEEALGAITAIVDTDEDEETTIIWDGLRAYIYGFLFESSFKNEIQKIKQI